MTNRLFGTDGVRGRVGTELTGDLAFRLGKAAAGYFLERGVGRAILARDTRASGGMLSQAFLSGAAAVGVEAVDLGIAPTPAVSVVLSSQKTEPAFGVVVSASHNPYYDNGIKLFSPAGGKLSAAEEEAVERRVRTSSELDASDETVGKIRQDPALLDAYFQNLRKLVPPRLKKIRLVVDAAHGAWGPHVKSIFSSAADEVEILNADYSGTDINENCGSTHLEALDPHLAMSGIGRSVPPCTPAALPPSVGVGLAFDGDGDRMLIRINHMTVDGDALLYLFAKHLVTSGPVVGTVMSNGALAAALENMGRTFLRAPVGDREVFEMMSDHGADLGGEQSGHIIFRRFQRTGDGAVTALSFLNVLAGPYGESIEALRKDLPEPFPQKLINLRVAEKRPWENDCELSSAIETAKTNLGRRGRLVIRYSGTEPLLRLMAECPSADAVESQLAFLADLFSEKLK